MASATPAVDAAAITEDRPVFQTKDLRVSKCTDTTISLAFSLERSDNGGGIEPIEPDTSAPVVGTMGAGLREPAIALQLAEKMTKWQSDQMLSFKVSKSFNTMYAGLASFVSSETWTDLPVYHAKGNQINKNSFKLVIGELDAETPYSFRVVVQAIGGDGKPAQIAGTTLSATAAAEQARAEEEAQVRKLHASKKATLLASKPATATE